MQTNPATKIDGTLLPGFEKGDVGACIAAFTCCVATETVTGIPVVPFKVAVVGLTVQVASAGAPAQVKVMEPVAPVQPAISRLNVAV
jgi:hypothetical protein